MKPTRPKNGIAKALRTPLYKMQVVPSKKHARESRKKIKHEDDEMMRKKNKIVTVQAELKKERPDSYMVFAGHTDTNGKEIWIPLAKSLVDYDAQAGTFSMAEWLAIEKGLENNIQD